MGAVSLPVDNPGEPLKKRPVNFNNLLLGAVMNLFEINTLGQPLEVIKTQMASNRNDSIPTCLKKIWGRGGFLGFYQGLIPWAWIEAATKGSVFLFAATECEYIAKSFGASPVLSGMFSGMGGGLAQAYVTMGFTTCMKTAEITRNKHMAEGLKPPSTFKVFADLYRTQGLAGINKGVNAVAIRQMTNWGSRILFARSIESWLHKYRGLGEHEKLSTLDKLIASTIGGGLNCWNQPIEVVRVEMQSMASNKSPNRPAHPTVFNTLAYIYKENGIKGLYRGATPRIGLGAWQTICMISFADYVRDALRLEK